MFDTGTAGAVPVLYFSPAVASDGFCMTKCQEFRSGMSGMFLLTCGHLQVPEPFRYGLSGVQSFFELLAAEKRTLNLRSTHAVWPDCSGRRVQALEGLWLT